MHTVRTVGMGSTNSDINTGVSTAGALLGAAAQGGLLTSIGIASSAVPIIGLAVLGATTLIQAFHIGEGCGASCTQTTQIVDRVIPLAQQNLQAAQTQLTQNGGCLTQAEQQVLLSNFDQLWNAIVQGCTQVGGQGGSQCISDRQRGGKYDMFKDLRDPISAMPVCTNSAGISSNASVSEVLSSDVAGVPLPLILAGAVAVIVLAGRKG